MDVQVASCYRAYVSGRSRAGSGDGRTGDGRPVYHTGTDGGQNLSGLIISSTRGGVGAVACHRRLVCGLVRQNVKHFDVFMTASDSSARSPAAHTDRPCHASSPQVHTLDPVNKLSLVRTITSSLDMCK